MNEYELLTLNELKLKSPFFDKFHPPLSVEDLQEIMNLAHKNSPFLAHYFYQLMGAGPTLIFVFKKDEDACRDLQTIGA